MPFMHMIGVERVEAKVKKTGLVCPFRWHANMCTKTVADLADTGTGNELLPNSGKYDRGGNSYYLE